MYMPGWFVFIHNITGKETSEGNSSTNVRAGGTYKIQVAFLQKSNTITLM